MLKWETHPILTMSAMVADDQVRRQGISSFSHNHMEYSSLSTRRVNTLRLRQNGRHLADDIFKCIFLNENVLIIIKFSLTLVPRGWINNIPALIQIMAWRRPGDKPLTEPMMVNSLMHIYVTQPQWVKSSRSMCQSNTWSWYWYWYPDITQQAGGLMCTCTDRYGANIRPCTKPGMISMKSQTYMNKSLMLYPGFKPYLILMPSWWHAILYSPTIVKKKKIIIHVNNVRIITYKFLFFSFHCGLQMTYGSGWNCQPWPSRSQNWMLVYFISILSRSQQFPTSSSQNQVELGEWVTGHFMHCIWHHRIWSALNQIMVCCLFRSNHHLNQLPICY